MLHSLFVIYGENQLLGFIITLSSVFIMQIGYILQKIGISGLKIHQVSIINKLKSKTFYIWILGTLLTGFGSISFFYALTLSSLSQLQPILGIGPLIISLLSVFILNESLRQREWIGVILSTIGLFFLPIFSQAIRNQGAVNESSILLISLILIIIAYVVDSIFQHYDLFGNGILEGMLAGLLAGFSSVFAKLGIPPLLESYSIHWAIIALIISQFGAFVLLQQGFARGDVSKVASIFTSISILNPVLFGIFLFGESFHVGQGIGISFIILGAILLSQKSQFDLKKHQS